MRSNTKKKTPQPQTHEGAPADRITAEQELRRSVMSCLLWESEFYEDGVAIADRIVSLVRKVTPLKAGRIAVEARHDMKLRHVPLLIAAALCRVGSGNAVVRDTVANVIDRADELAEFLAIYAKVNGTTPDKLKPVLSAQAKKGLAQAFRKFDAYQLAKYDRAGMVRLRDALFLCHARPADEEQAALWKQLVDGTLPAPDTWEVALSGGADKKETFERLLREGKLGYLALLRNLRNMTQAGVDEDLIRDAILARKGAHRVLPFRYVAAARAVPSLEPVIDDALRAVIADMTPLPGRTIILVDVSGSMDSALSGRSDLTRMDAAAALASIVPGDVRVFSFSDRIVEVPPRRGMAGVDAVIKSQSHSGTELGAAVRYANDLRHDRLIVISDEQSRSPVPQPVAERAYMINVASAQNGVSYRGRWRHIDGFSENVLRWIAAVEQEAA